MNRPSLDRHAAAIARAGDADTLARLGYPRATRAAPPLPAPTYPVDKRGRVVRVPRPGDPYPVDKRGRIVR